MNTVLLLLVLHRWIILNTLSIFWVHYTLSYHESTLQGFTLEEEWMLMLGFNSNDDPASINSSNYSFRPILFNATKWNQLVWRWSARRRHSRTSNFYEKRNHRSQAIVTIQNKSFCFKHLLSWKWPDDVQGRRGNITKGRWQRSSALHLSIMNRTNGKSCFITWL